jgi:hypothetical protein
MVELGPLSNQPWPDKVPGPYTPGFFVCVSTTGWGSTLIKLGTRSRYSHTFMITSMDGEIVQAMGGGVQKAHISDYAGRKMVISSGISMDKAQQDALVASALSMVGTPYNELGIVDDGLESLGIVIRWLADLANGDHEVICSQAAVLMGKAAGYDWMCGKRVASEVTPADLARLPIMHPFEVTK